MSKFLWCEDSKSGYQFWRAIFAQMLPEMNVESKGSNSLLRKAVCGIEADDNDYYIIMDTAVDNPDVLRETRYLAIKARVKDNIHIIRLHSFEFALLSFKLLEQWIFAEQDELKDQRQELLNARDVFIERLSDTGEASGLAAFKALFDAYEKKNSEQIAAKLLFEITRNTGFETDKSKLGDCFVNGCCEWAGRRDDDICGLDAHRINANEKARLLVERSILKKAFEGVGL